MEVWAVCGYHLKVGKYNRYSLLASLNFFFFIQICEYTTENRLQEKHSLFFKSCITSFRSMLFSTRIKTRVVTGGIEFKVLKKITSK